MDLGDYSASWVANGESAGIQVESAVVYPNSVIDTGYHWNDSVFGNDQFAQVTVAASASGLFIGPAVRCDLNSAATYYAYYASSTARYLIKSVSGVITTLRSTVAAGIVNGDVLRLEAVGNKLTPFINGTKDTLVGSIVDTAISSGSAGLAALGEGSGTSLSNWEAGMVGTAPTNYSEFAGAPFGAPSMQMQALTQINGIAPDAIAASTNLTGAVAAVQDDPDAADATWLTATSAIAATDLRVSFPATGGFLTPAAAQNFRYLVRKTTGTPTPTVTAELRESNVLRKTFATATPVSSTTGTVLQGDWTNADVTAQNGDNVELRLVSSPGIGSAPLQHFSKFDGTARTTTSTTAVEQANYTILWTDLTAAGFAAADNALIIVGVKMWGSTVSVRTSFAIGFGTTFAARTEDTTSVQVVESPATAAGPQYLWVDRRALVVNQNIYFRVQTSLGTASYDEFVCFILNYDDIPASDKLYAEATHSGNAPTTYGVAGAGAATPSAGDWWIIASSKWLVDGVIEDMYLAINDGTADVSEVSSQSENALDERVIGTMAYKAALGSGVTVRARYKEVGATAPPDIASTQIFGLRLNTFADHWGAHTSNTVTHSVIDTYQTVASNASYVLGNTGPFVVFGWPIHLMTDGSKRPYGKIQINAADWVSATTNRSSINDSGAANKIAPLLYGYNAAQAAATLNLTVQVAEDVDIAPTYTCNQQVAVAFSLFTPGTATNTVEYGAIKWNASVDVPFTDTRDVAADAAVLKLSISAAVSADASVSKQFSVAPTADAAVKKQLSAAPGADAAIRASLLSTTNVDAAALKTLQAIPSADGAVSKQLAAIPSADGAVQKPITATTNVAAAVLKTLQAAPVADTAVQKQQQSASLSAAAAVLKALQAGASADTAVMLLSRSVALSADVWAALARTATLSANAGVAAATSASTSAIPVVAIGRTVAATADAVVLATKTAAVGLDSAVLKTLQTGVSADVAPAIAGSAVISVNAGVAVALTLATSANAGVAVQRTVAVTADAAVLAAKNATVSADSAVRTARSSQPQVDVAVALPRTAAISANAGVAAVTSASVSANPAVAINPSIATNADGAVKALALSVTLTADVWATVPQTAGIASDAAILTTLSTFLVARPVVAITPSVEISANAVVLVARTDVLGHDTAVLATLNIASTGNGAVSVSRSAQSIADGVVLLPRNVQSSVDGAIRATVAATTEADASVIQAGVNQTAIVADAAVIASRTIASSADAWIAVLNSRSVSADAAASKAQSATVAADVILAFVTQVSVPADAAVLKLALARTVSLDAVVGVFAPFVAIPRDGCTIGRLAELRVVSMPAPPRTIINPAILRSVTAPAIIPPEVP